MEALKKKLIADYGGDDDTTYAQRTNAAISDYFAQMPPSKSTLDPQRIGSKTVSISDETGVVALTCRLRSAPEVNSQ